MLALEVALAGTSPVPTFVFDEVDAGVGGAAAVEVGRRLAQLARTAQVLVVTHLPQVAAYADRHVVVEKSSDGTVTSSGLTVLDDEQRERELSRMLAGLADSDTALAHARELLDVAQEARGRPLTARRARVRRGPRSGAVADWQDGPVMRSRSPLSSRSGPTPGPIAPARDGRDRPRRHAAPATCCPGCAPVTSPSSTTSTWTARPPRRSSTPGSSPSSTPRR